MLTKCHSHHSIKSIIPFKSGLDAVANMIQTIVIECKQENVK